MLSACNIIEDATQHLISFLNNSDRHKNFGALLPGTTPNPDKIRLDPQPCLSYRPFAPQNPALFSLRIFTPPFFQTIGVKHATKSAPVETKPKVVQSIPYSQSYPPSGPNYPFQSTIHHNTSHITPPTSGQSKK